MLPRAALIGSPAPITALDTRGHSVGLFRPYQSKKTESEPSAEATPSGPTQIGRPAGKGAPTPSRRTSEAARRQRINPVLTKKEIRQKEQVARVKATSQMDQLPERQLLRDYIDARWNIGEFLMPIMLVLLMLSFTATAYPTIYTGTTIAVWVLMLLVIVDTWRMWRGYKKVLAERHPRSSSRGLLMLALNRTMAIRRFRVPPPRIKRGEKY